MTTGSANSSAPLIGRYRYLLLTSSVLTYLLITMGGVVCVTGSGLGCPDWPGCYGQVVPPMRMDAIIEYTHRFLAALTGPFVIAAAVVGWVRFRSIRWLSRTAVLAVGFMLAVVVFGALAVLRGLSRGLAVLDLGSALLVLILMVTATVVAFLRHRHPDLPDRLPLRSSFARLALGTLVAAFIVLVSGILAAGSGSITRCVGWPLYGGSLVSIDPPGWLQITRRLVSIAASLMVIAVVIQAWRTQRMQRAIMSTTMVMGVLWLIETAVGALLTVSSSPAVLLVIYSATAGALLASLVVLVALAALAPLLPAEERTLLHGVKPLA
jgi:cytochrome c oxidase assembly protein subunit 15